MFQSVSIFSLYNSLFQCFETPEMGPGIFTFSRACFNFVLKRFETTETFGLSQFSSCFSFVSKRLKKTETLVNFCHVSVRFKNVSKHQKLGLFQFVSKQLKCSAIFIIFSVFQSFETTETIEPFGLVLDLVILQKFIFLYSLCVSMFHWNKMHALGFCGVFMQYMNLEPVPELLLKLFC